MLLRYEHYSDGSYDWCHIQVLKIVKKKDMHGTQNLSTAL